MKTYNDIGFEVSELFEFQREVLEGIANLDVGDEKTRQRVARIVRNKLEDCRANVRAFNHLEKSGHIVVDRS